MSLKKHLTSNPLFWFAVVIGVLGIAAAVFPYAYQRYGEYLVSQGVSTSIRPTGSCNPEALGPCDASDTAEVRP